MESAGSITTATALLTTSETTQLSTLFQTINKPFHPGARTVWRDQGESAAASVDQSSRISTTAVRDPRLFEFLTLINLNLNCSEGPSTV